MFDRTMRETVNYSNEKEKQNENNNNESQLPAISEKRIYIHKPSDFLKNKYTFFGNLANNKDLLSMDSRRTYHSHKFNMKDFKKQMKQGDQIIESIIKDDTKVLPNLLRNYENNHLNKDTFNSSIMNLNNTKNTSSNNYRINNSSKTFNNSNINLYNYNNGLKMINQKSEKLVNLNFVVSSPKKKINLNKNNLYQLNGCNRKKNPLQSNYNQKNYKSNYYSMDASPRMSNPNLNHY